MRHGGSFIIIYFYPQQLQYRMHPEICRFPSLHFYNKKLLNGAKMYSKIAPFHATECLGPYVFFDVIDGQELHGKNSGALSLYNECEADAAVELLQFFRMRYISPSSSPTPRTTHPRLGLFYSLCFKSVFGYFT